MPTSFPTLPAKFVGREDYVARLKARLEHFRFFLYEGISGVGKTSLLLRLAKECKSVGMTGAIYLPVHPGEGVSSILARLECRALGNGRLNLEHQGDPYVRLVDLLESRKLVLILDALQNLRRDELPALVRIFAKAKAGQYRVLGAIRGDPALSVMDRGSVHQERVGALSGPEVRELGTAWKLSGPALDALEADAARGGASAHPLTCRYLLALCGADLPSPEILAGQSARSVHAFKALMGTMETHLPAEERALLAALAHIGLPLHRDVAAEAFGPVLERTIKHGLLDVIEGDVYAHHLVGQYVGADKAHVSGDAAKRVAAHLKERALRLGEPLAAIRAAEVLAHAGFTDIAVESLATGWEWVRDPGFLEAYLKTLATIPAAGELAPRLKLLAVQARMRQGNPLAVVADMERLSHEPDLWTKSRALASLAYIQSELHAHEKVVVAFTELQRLAPGAETLLATGVLAVEAMVRLDRMADAQALAHSLLPSVVGKPAAEGELRRLLARALAQTARLNEAVDEAVAAAKCFEAAGDLYHLAAAYGFIGDLYREAGEFDHAKEAFAKFLEVATHWGDRNLIQIAQLADAWVALDIGDVIHAAKRVAAVQKELGPAPSRRLKRYLAALQGLLEAGRGHHEEAAKLLTRVVETWEAAGQRTIAGSLKAQLVRSLIACGKLDEAEAIVTRSLAELDPETNAPRVASLLRESALIRLRRHDPERALTELSRACQLFAKGGNRREEALTLHRIAHAALDEGKVDMAAAKASEAFALANEIKHARARALATELRSRIALIRDEPDKAEEYAREATQSLRRLGDELGVLHVSETLLRAHLCTGDLGAALRLGPKLRDHAEQLQVTEVRVRAIALTGIALLRKNRLAIAARCFRELPVQGFSAATRVLMYRFGEALALGQNDQQEAMKRRGHWIIALKELPPHRRAHTSHEVAQLALAPRDRCELRTATGARLVSTEELGLLDPKDYGLLIDVLYRRVYDGGKIVKLPSPEHAKLLMRLVLAAPGAVPVDVARATLAKPVQKASKDAAKDDAAADAAYKSAVKELQKALKDAPQVQVESDAAGLRLVPPASYAFLLPVWLTRTLSTTQKDILKLLRRLGSAPMLTIQEHCKLSRAAARRDMGQLTKTNLVESVREGRGQVYRLA